MISKRRSKSSQRTRKLKQRGSGGPAPHSSSPDFNNIKHPDDRSIFYEALGEDFHKKYVVNLFTLAIHIEKELRNFKIKRGKYTFKIKTNEEGYCMDIFGGSLFFILYLEAKKLGLIDEEDEKLFLSNFLEYKTIDVDCSLTYKITPELDEEDENNSDIFTDFSLGLQEHIEKSVRTIIGNNRGLQKFTEELRKRNFIGEDFPEDHERPFFHILPKFDNMGVFSLSINMHGTPPRMEIRPQINTCVQTSDTIKCDHILEILCNDDTKLGNVNVYDLSILKGSKFLGRTLIKMCMENIDRLYRTATDDVRTNLWGKKKTIISKITKLIRDDPIYKTKYMQGYHRVQFLHLLAVKLLKRRSPKFDYLKNLFIDEESRWESFRNIRNNKTINSIVSPELLDTIRRELNRIDDLPLKQKNTLENAEFLIRSQLQIWVSIHTEILTSYKKPDEELTDYIGAPRYSSSISENNDTNTNSSSPDNLRRLTDDEIFTLYKRLFKKRVVVTSATRDLVILQIRKKLNRT